MHTACFTREKFPAGNFSFARAFICPLRFFLCRLWEKRVDMHGEKRLEIGTTRCNAREFSSTLGLPFMQDLTLAITQSALTD